MCIMQVHKNAKLLGQHEGFSRMVQMKWIAKLFVKNVLL